MNWEDYKLVRSFFEQKEEFEPKNEEELERYKNADLITLPPDVSGTNCSNCNAYKKLDENSGFCEDKRVQVTVGPRMCCKYWDNDGVKRSWGEMKA